ncbi:MAG: hypothetical protein H5T62_14395 [Anaerolineae bacterium]|nr:hypothetical protein [Anaerolineae bacterium]
MTETSKGWGVEFWVSQNCHFRHTEPDRTRLVVEVSAETLTIDAITPPVEYIQDPMYCQSDGDCLCLSGSGVPFVGCTNYFYAPLHWAGYYSCGDCLCEDNQCVSK